MCLVGAGVSAHVGPGPEMCTLTMGGGVFISALNPNTEKTCVIHEQPYANHSLQGNSYHDNSISVMAIKETIKKNIILETF